MKKREFDLFNILLGLIIGVILGYFAFSKIQITQTGQTNPVGGNEVYGTVYTIQLGCNDNMESLNIIKERFNVLGLYYEIYEEGGKYYILNSVYDTLEKAQTKKQIIESCGFNVSIRSDYILDLSKNVITSNEEYEFYNEIIFNLLNSMKNEPIVISDIYYSNPINIELLSNITILMTIKNNQIKENYQINTFCLLLKKLK